MKIVVSAVLLLLQPMIAKSVPGINAGEVWLLSNCVFTCLAQIN